MSGSTAYLDTSAFLKLLVAEDESAALAEALLAWPDRASSALLRTEAVSALRRSGHDNLLGPTRLLLGAMHLVRIDEPLLDRASDLEPRGLRSLDAIHLATALALGSDVGAVITYDDRLGDAARAQGLRVERPE